MQFLLVCVLLITVPFGLCGDSSHGLNAQGSVEVIVLDADGYEPIIFCQVVPLERDTFWYTDFDGRTTVDFAADSVSLVFSYAGFKPQMKVLSNDQKKDTVLLSTGITGGIQDHFALIMESHPRFITPEFIHKTSAEMKASYLAGSLSKRGDRMQNCRTVMTSADAPLSLFQSFSDPSLLHIQNCRRISARDSTKTLFLYELGKDQLTAHDEPIDIDQLRLGIYEVYVPEFHVYWFNTCYLSCSEIWTKRIDLPVAVIVIRD